MDDNEKDKICEDQQSKNKDCSTCPIYPCEPLPKTETEIMNRNWV